MDSALSPADTFLQVLDSPQEWSAFSRAVADRPGVWESSVVINGMHCTACSITVEEAVQKIPGVLGVRVSAASHRAQVVWTESQVAPSVWMGAVQSAGYQALPANDIFAGERRRQETRQALWRWLVAGLCMMQVMMYAYPAYIAQEGDLSAEMEQLLRWASWVLTLPVMLFSSGPFFKAALRDMRHARISMDLPVALGIGITFIVSSMGTFEPQGVFGREVYFDSLTMFVFFLLTGRWLELRLRDRTAGALEALMNRLPDSVERCGADGRFERVACRRLRVGDVVRVRPGESFPADGCITSGETTVDESLMTGESHPLPRAKGEVVLCGSHNLSGTVTLSVQGVGAATRYAQIVALMDSAASSKPTVALLADRWARPFLLAVLMAAGGACAWWWSRDPGHALMVSVAVLIVTCPCALSLATPAAMLASAGALAKAGVLVRRLQAFEALSHVDTLVFDKTGTLTCDRMALQAAHARVGSDADSALQIAAALARHSLHPVSRALVDAANKRNLPTPDWSCEGVTETSGQGVSGQGYRLGSAIFCGLSEPSGRHGLAHVFLADARGYLARFDFEESVRPHAEEVVAALKAEGLDVHLMSGDLAASVQALAARIGIDKVQGGCTPIEKLHAVKALQHRGRVVAMVGDGLNDGPVLAAADVSVAFANAVPLAQAQADFVVLGSDIRQIFHLLQRARKTLRVVRQNLYWALAYNAACVPLAVAGYLPAWLAGLGMATSSLVVVLNAARLATSDSLEVIR